MVNVGSGKSFLECPLIRDFNVFFSFPFSRTWVSDQCSFSIMTSVLAFVVPKQLYLS